MGNSFENILSSADEAVEQSASRVIEKQTVVEDGPEEGWVEVEGKQSSLALKNVSDWGTRDFYHYFLNLFESHFNESFDVAPAPGQQAVLLIKDAIAKEMGQRPSNKLVKDYIEWYMANMAPKMIAKYGCLKMKFFRTRWHIESFLDIYRKTQDRKKPEKSSSILFTDDSMRAVYASSPKNFVLKYGLVLSTVWLMRKNGMTEQEAVAVVSEQACILVEEGQYNGIIASTEKHAPYPRWCYFRSFDSMPRDLTIETGQFFDVLSVKFSDYATQFLFLKEEAE